VRQEIGPVEAGHHFDIFWITELQLVTGYHLQLLTFDTSALLEHHADPGERNMSNFQQFPLALVCILPNCINS
jgi:hypothetical protein